MHNKIVKMHILGKTAWVCGPASSFFFPNPATFFPITGIVPQVVTTGSPMNPVEGPFRLPNPWRVWGSHAFEVGVASEEGRPK